MASSSSGTEVGASSIVYELYGPKHYNPSLNPNFDRQHADIGRLISVLTHGRIDHATNLMGWDVKGVNSRLLLAIDVNRGRSVVGMGMLSYFPLVSGREIRFDDVVVLPEYQGHGIGRSIIEKLIAEGKRMGGEWVELTSGPERRAAHKLYRDLGFMEVRTTVFQLDLTV